MKKPYGKTIWDRHFKVSDPLLFRELVDGSDHIQKGTDALGKLKKIRRRVKKSCNLSDTERQELLNTIDKRVEGLINALYH